MTTAPIWNADWNAATGTAVAKIMGDVWKNEEARFSNLNTRGVAVISASSVVTALLGFFNKNLLDATASQLSNGLRTFAQWGLGVSIGLLVLTISIIVLGVLRPGGRGVFGANDITGGRDLTPEGVDEAVYLDLGAVYQGLVNRNAKKAHWLNLGYLSFFLAVLIAAATSVYVLANFAPPPV